MEYDELYKKYIKLQKENDYLKNENVRLNNLVSIIQKKEFHAKHYEEIQKKSLNITENSTEQKTYFDPHLNNNSSPEEKINLFHSLFVTTQAS